MNNIDIDTDDLHKLLKKIENTKGTLEQMLKGIAHIGLVVSQQEQVIKDLEDRIEKLERKK